MSSIAAASSFLCTLPGAGKGIAYHLAVSFLEVGHPTAVRFTSFVGEGRRSFELLITGAALPDALASNCEALCRVAIAQAIRDHLYEKTREGEHQLDRDAVPWDGELRPVGGGVVPDRPRARFPMA